MTQLIEANEAGIEAAAALLRSGKLVAFGTETVYGLGGEATQDSAVAAIFEAKGRPRFNPLICHFPAAADAFGHVDATSHAQILAEEFWPGPLTLVLRRRPDCRISLLAGAGLDTLAVRVPRHPAARALLHAAAVPIAAPSANRSGGVSPTSAAHVLADLEGKIAAILDCGPCTVGIESTVLDLTGPAPILLRPGGVPAEAIEALIGPISRAAAVPDTAAGLPSPGLLTTHYAPALPVRLAAAAAQPHEALLAFGPYAPPARLTYTLSSTGNLVEAAARLFEGLRWLDAQAARAHLTGIAVMPIPSTGIGAAINDRLARAATPRQ